jgi:hypothetical protein
MTALEIGGGQSLLAALNQRRHQIALYGFMVVVLAHWAEHIAQIIQFWGLGWPRAQAKGLLGYYYPRLVTSEWLHYGFAVVMLIGLILLRPGFVGRARTWWNVALWIQVWHHFEHLLLLIQASTHSYFFGKKVPTSTLQLLFPRIELHLFYNSIVSIPMAIAMVLHLRPNKAERNAMRCSCAVGAHAH